MRPWGPDGALLCNSEATKFKLNFQCFYRLETFEYGFPQIEFQIQESVDGGLDGREALNSDAAARITAG